MSDSNQKKSPGWDDVFTNLTGADEQVLEGDGEELAEPSPLEAAAEAPPADTPKGVPEWVKEPPGLVYPPKPVMFMRFRAEWTDVPTKGERQCILWSLSVTEERLALKRAQGDSLRTYKELAMQCIRVVDGVKADWTGKPMRGSVTTFWNEIGPKCRALIENYYHRAHTLSAAEGADFFLHCAASRNVVAG